jgi:hypothetical protein
LQTFRIRFMLECEENLSAVGFDGKPWRAGLIVFLPCAGGE